MNEQPKKPVKRYVFDDLSSQYYAEYDEPQVSQAEKVSIRQSPESQRTFVPKKEGPRFSIIDTFYFKPDEHAPAEPRAEFHSILHKLLELVQEVLFANTTVLFWVIKERKILAVADKITNSSTFTKELRFPIGNDVISRIALSGKPEIISEINPASEIDVVPYYESPAGVKSLIGVPIFYHEDVIAILAADSLADEGFGRETVPLLGNFTRLFSAVLRALTDKYDLAVTKTAFGSLKWLANELMSKSDLESILTTIVTAVSDTVDAEFVTLVSQSDLYSWTVSRVMKRSGAEYVEEGCKIGLNETLAGKAIRENRPLHMEDLSKVEEHRFTQSEPSGKGSFVAIPISGLHECFGLVTVESLGPAKFSSLEVDGIKQLVNLGALAAEVNSANQLIDNFIVFDKVTRTLNKKFFLERLEEEIGRIADLGIKSVLVLIGLDRVDDIRNRFSNEGVDYILSDVAEIVRGWLKPYDAIGKVSAHSFGVILEGFSQHEALAWGEKFRKNLATKVYQIGSRNYMATISVAVLNIDGKNDPSEFLITAQKVLQRAHTSGGNVVKIL
ncbi:MAG TPA: GAF domain-containing protein [Candidatus Acidoferrales bacterium]|nr:GAF domain-containing protein [Candidatus Acidoferrales bacterium]